MELVRKLLVICIFWSSSFSYAFEDGTYLHQVIEDPSYLTAWNELFENSADVDDWLKEYSVTLDGVQSQVLKMEVEGSRYEVFKVCKPHDCGDNAFAVIFLPSNGEALGLLVKSKYVRVYNENINRFESKRLEENRFFGSWASVANEKKLKKMLVETTR